MNLTCNGALMIVACASVPLATSGTMHWQARPQGLQFPQPHLPHAYMKHGALVLGASLPRSSCGAVGMTVGRVMNKRHIRRLNRKQIVTWLA